MSLFVILVDSSKVDYTPLKTIWIKKNSLTNLGLIFTQDFTIGHLLSYSLIFMIDVSISMTFKLRKLFLRRIVIK